MIDQQTPARRLVKLAEARERFPAVSLYTLRRMIRQGALTGFKPNGSRLLLVDADELDRAILEDGRVRPTTAS